MRMTLIMTSYVSLLVAIILMPAVPAVGPDNSCRIILLQILQ